MTVGMLHIYHTLQRDRFKTPGMNNAAYFNDADETHRTLKRNSSSSKRHHIPLMRIGQLGRRLENSTVQ